MAIDVEIDSKTRKQAFLRSKIYLGTTPKQKAKEDMSWDSDDTISESSTSEMRNSASALNQRSQDSSSSQPDLGEELDHLLILAHGQGEKGGKEDLCQFLSG
jgi:hypothetical protein